MAVAQICLVVPCLLRDLLLILVDPQDDLRKIILIQEENVKQIAFRTGMLDFQLMNFGISYSLFEGHQNYYFLI